MERIVNRNPAIATVTGSEVTEHLRLTTLSSRPLVSRSQSSTSLTSTGVSPELYAEFFPQIKHCIVAAEDGKKIGMGVRAVFSLQSLRLGSGMPS